MSSMLPDLRTIMENPQSVPDTIDGWLAAYHSRESYSARPLGQRDPRISRFLTYYAVYSKIFRPQDQTSYELPVVNLRNIPSKSSFLAVLDNEGHLCGSGTYRSNGLLDSIGSALSDLASAVVDYSYSVLDYLVPRTFDQFVSRINDQVEEWLLDGTAARTLGAALALTPCSTVCYSIGESIAQAQNALNRADYFGQKPEDFVNITYFVGRDQQSSSVPKSPDRGAYKFYCWRLSPNFVYGLSTARPFERVELKFLVNLASFLAPFFKEVVARDRIPVNTDVVIAALIRKSVELSQTLSSLELMRLFFAIKSLASDVSYRFDRISQTGIPYRIVPEIDVLVEEPQIEALLLIARQNPSVVCMFANITKDPNLLQLARNTVPEFTSQRVEYLHFTEELNIELDSVRSDDLEIAISGVNASKSEGLPLAAQVFLTFAISGGAIYAFSKIVGR